MNIETSQNIFFTDSSLVQPDDTWLRLNSDQSLETLDLFGASIYIDLSEDLQDTLLKHLHGHKDGWSTIIHSKRASPLSAFLSDGVLDFESFPGNNEKLSLLDETPRDKLLAYLWLNPQRELRPLKDVLSNSIYKYPLLEIYQNSEVTPFRYLTRLTNDSQLATSECVDRLRYCSRCQSSHLNYVDSCPSCSSIDITTFDALHCFTCGHVDDSEQFLMSSSMQCPKCLTHLKHIGVDYDRPLEMYTCRTCSNEFVEAGILAKCLSCDSESRPESLKSNTYFTYKAGENARQNLIKSIETENFGVNLNGTVSAKIFESVTSWKNKLSTRHDHQDLLLGLKLDGADAFRTTMGEVAFIELMATLSENLDNIFRDTDLSCQYEDDLMFVYLPHFNFDFMNVLEGRLTDFAEKIETDLIKVNVMHWKLPDESIHSMQGWLKSCSSQFND